MRNILFVLLLFSAYFSFAEEDVLYQYQEGNVISYHTSLFDNRLPLAKFTCVEGKIIAREFYTYNDCGQVEAVIQDDGNSFDIADFSQVTGRHLIKIHYRQEQPGYGLPGLVEDFVYDLSSGELHLAHQVIYHYNDQGKMIQQDHYDSSREYRYSIYHPEEQKKELSWWESIQETFSSIRDFINTHLSLEYQFKEKIEEGALTVFSQSSLVTYGFYADEACTGTYGQGEINDKVRITLINGILNARHDVLDAVEKVSQFHGNNNIHYIFRPTEGWTYDLVKSTFVRFGWVSPQAKLLAAKWRDLIEDMGGTEGEGKIIHYAHSIGASETLCAKTLLSPEELKMIQVYTIGSPNLIEPGGFQSVVNYVSRGDGVSILDPIPYFQAMIDPKEHIVFLAPSWGAPLIDHPLQFPTYLSLLEMLGKQFLDRYSK